GTSFVDARYQLVDERVLRRALTAWRHAGIRSVIVPGRDTGRITGVVRRTLDELGLRWWFTNPPRNRYTDDLEGIARPAVGVFFADSPWCAQQCSAQPEAVARLIRRVRTLVTNSINLPPP